MRYALRHYAADTPLRYADAAATRCSLDTSFRLITVFSRRFSPLRCFYAMMFRYFFFTMLLPIMMLFFFFFFFFCCRRALPIRHLLLMPMRCQQRHLLCYADYAVYLRR